MDFLLRIRNMCGASGSVARLPDHRGLRGGDARDVAGGLHQTAEYVSGALAVISFREPGGCAEMVSFEQKSRPPETFALKRSRRKQRDAFGVGEYQAADTRDGG